MVVAERLLHGGFYALLLKENCPSPEKVEKQKRKFLLPFHITVPHKNYGSFLPKSNGRNQKSNIPINDEPLCRGIEGGTFILKFSSHQVLPIEFSIPLFGMIGSLYPRLSTDVIQYLYFLFVLPIINACIKISRGVSP